MRLSVFGKVYRRKVRHGLGPACRGKLFEEAYFWPLSAESFSITRQMVSFS